MQIPNTGGRITSVNDLTLEGPCIIFLQYIYIYIYTYIHSNEIHNVAALIVY